MEKLKQVRTYLNTMFVEREQIVEALLLALLSRQHVLLIGPPGTGKSAIVSELAKMISGMNYFQWLLSRFSTPEELFGPVSLKELEQGIYKRNTAGKMPESHLTFCDEIFKANSAILNSLLTLINERLFYNNGAPIACPLMSVIGASNEYPEEGEGLEALFDRFLLRFEVNYIGEDAHFISMLKGGVQIPKERPTLTLQEIEHFQFLSGMVEIPDNVLHTLVQVRNELKKEGICPSDRRFKQSLNLIQAKAALEQRQQASQSDLIVLTNALWETVDQRDKVVQIVRSHAVDKLQQVLERITAEGKSIFEHLQKSQKSSQDALEAVDKYKSLEKELDQLKRQYSSRSTEVDSVFQKVSAARKQVSAAVLN